MSTDATSTTGYATILVDRAPEGALVVTLNRPDVLNSFNEAMRADFARLWAAVRTDRSVRSVVLQAAGERAFSTGLDVTERMSDEESPWLDRAAPFAEREDPGHELSPKRNAVWKPVVAAVHGMCAGGAFYWIADCDIVICEPGATFFDPHVSYGMVAALEPVALSYRMNFSDVARMALLGLSERMSAERALATGLVTEVVPRDELRARALQLATAMARSPAAAIEGTVKALWQSRDLGRTQALATALMYTQVGNPIAADGLDRSAARPKEWWTR
ncbi:MAG: enoyl-CoA hydratase/isomerase family protein [Pseudonocardia sp.]|nr:enoyl-CoA hydratase/isomerase family protein [Pseudonocardia sp.]